MEDQTLTYLQQASEISHKINGVQNDINYISRQLAATKQMGAGSYGFTIASAIVGWLPGLLLGVFIADLFSIRNSGGMVVALCVVSYIVLLVLSILYDTKSSNKAKQQKYDRISYLQKEIDTRNLWISRYIEKHIDVVSKVPSKYFYPIAIDYFIEVISNGRADTLKEAMNLFEEQLHRWKIEDMTKSAMIAQQQTAANSAAIRTSSAINAAANVANLLSK